MTLESIFAAASQKPPTERAAFLGEACGTDADLRRKVERLLAAHDAAGSFLEPQTGDYQSQASTDEAAGTVIAGKYKLLELIGEGGMGSVWMAQQSEPVKRLVAAKLIKAGMDSKAVLARFEAERQALAVMDHPNIAKILDGGVDNSRPYFVMELVKGVPITKYCDAHKLTPRERLELFVPVCQAIQHAHQKGIIHRDIKPSNVMIALYDDKPVPKVIDFGVAKATGQTLTEHTLNTGFGGIVGTPEYMSPEQASLNNLDIDTRSDIYSLGVLLYELLAGSPPFKRKELEQAGLLEILRVIREDEPPRPSTKLSTADALPSLSASRGTEPKKLTGILRNELDWIVMKALEKDRARRYETANGFAADINRYLNGEPVQAHPPSTWYRLQKYARRHSSGFIMAGALFLGFVLLVAGQSYQLIQVSRAEQEASKRAEGERVAKEEAQTRESETKAVLEFVENKVFAAARPKDQEGGQGYEVKLADAISAALPYVEKSFTDQPLIEARLRMTLGMSFFYLGKHDVAEQQFRRSRDLYTATLGRDHPDTLLSSNGLGISCDKLGRHAEALAIFEETLKLRKAKLGTNHPETLGSMTNLAATYINFGRFPESLALFEETLKLQKSKLGTDHPTTLASMNGLAQNHSALGRYPEAARLYEDTLKLVKAKLGADHPTTLTIAQNLAHSYHSLGRHEEELKLLEDVLTRRKAQLGPNHPDTFDCTRKLAHTYQALGRHAAALKLREETLPLMRATLGGDHFDTLVTMVGLGNSYAALGRHAEALKLREETMPLMKAKRPNDSETFWSMNNLAESYAVVGRYAEAIKLHEETLALRRAELGIDHPDTLGSMNMLSASYAWIGRYAEAIKLHEETLALRKAKLGPSHPDTLWSIYNIGCVHALMIAKAEDRGKQADLAMDWLRQAVAAGFKDVAQMKKDTDLDALREREDFKKLIAELEKKLETKSP